MSFIGVLETIGKDFTKGFSWAMKYALPAEKLTALLFPSIAPEMTAAAAATTLIQNAVLMVEQKYAAAGVSKGTWTQKLAELTLEHLATRLAAAVETIEQAIPRIVASGEAIGPIVATVESPREAELAQRLADAEKTIAELRASASTNAGRRTIPVSLAARHDGASADSGAIDAALTSLSLEQRIAVKSQLLRAGLI
jgi:hypothetical protein